jgi:hypothetical protein
MANTQVRSSGDDGNLDSTWSNASKLSSKVRELAHRSHRALKGWTGSPVSPNDIGDDLRELSDQVARLRRKIHERRLEALIPWVDALQHQVDDRLGDTRKAGPDGEPTGSSR